jgi:hypothetical protein
VKIGGRISMLGPRHLQDLSAKSLVIESSKRIEELTAALGLIVLVDPSSRGLIPVAVGKG